MSNKMKTIRTSKGDILNELKRRRDIDELGKNKTIRAIKKHYLPNMIAQSVALGGASKALQESLGNFMPAMHPGKSHTRNFIGRNYGTIIGAGVGAIGGIRTGRQDHNREKLMTDRMKDLDSQDLFGQLSDSGKEQYAYYLGKKKGGPIIKQLNDKKQSEREAIKKLRLEYRANNPEDIRIDMEKEANLDLDKPFQMGNIHKIPKQQLYDELAIRRAEAVGRRVKGMKRRDFSDGFKKRFKDSNIIKAHGIMSAIGAVGMHNNYKESLRKDEENKTPSIDTLKYKHGRWVAPLVFGPGAHVFLSGLGGAKNTVNSMISRKKNRYALADYSTEEIEKKLGKNLLNKLYREHGEEGEEHKDE